MTERRIAFVLKGYPRLSETFIAQEIHALEQAGLDLLIVSLRHPTDQQVHPVHEQIEAQVLYLPEYLHREPWRVLKGWWRSRKRGGYAAAREAWLSDLRRDSSRNRMRRFGQALVLAAELPADVDRIHAHFLHTPGSVTRYCAKLLGWPWSFSAHARDIWTTDTWEKREKLADCDWGVTCTQTNLSHLQSLCPRPEKLELLYHGLDLARFGPHARARGARDGSDAHLPVRILSVGRAVEKKGYDDLLKALAGLPTELNWRFEHIGGGADMGKLRRLCASLGVDSQVVWRGPRSQHEVLKAYREADLFVLASKTAADGDRDGLPNVIVEAQSQGLACVSTRLSAIPELLSDGINGLLVDPQDVAGLSAAMRRLIQDPVLRDRLGRAGEARVRECFDLQPGIERLSKLLQRPRPMVPEVSGVASMSVMEQPYGGATGD